jgi:hypothetical protein
MKHTVNSYLMTVLTAVAVIFLSFSANSFAASDIVRPEATDVTAINIGAVTNPPALRARTRAVGRVIEFGPSDMIFSVPVTIKLPYTAAALKQARIADKAELQVFCYDTVLLAWVPVDIDSIDPFNQLISIKTDHFSMYTIGAAVADNSAAGGVSCFVSSAQAGLLDTELPTGSILCLLALIGLLWLGNKKTKGKRPKKKRSAFGMRHAAYGARHTAHGARIKDHRRPDDKPDAPQLL